MAELPSESASEVAFHEVSFQAVGLDPRPHMHRLRASTVWVATPQLAGIFVTGFQRGTDVEPTMSLYQRLFTQPRDLFSDTRGFGVEDLIFDRLLRNGRLPHMPRRTALILPDGWTRAWWLGAADLLMSGAPIRAFDEPTPAWQWLDASPDTVRAVEHLRFTHTRDAGLLRELRALLEVDPSLPIERAAERLHLSPRGLQRALSAMGETFVELRSRARAEIALRRLGETDDKLEVVAAEAGFRSRSHFASWFRRVVGQTPDQFRRLKRSVKT